MTKTFCIRGEKYGRHHADYIAWCEVFTSLFIALVVGNADEFLKNIAHVVVVNGFKREVELCYLLNHTIKEIIACEAHHNLIKLEVLKDCSNLRVKSRHIVAEVHRDILGIIEQ